MLLKRLYDHDAPKKEWVVQEEECKTCSGKGKVVNNALDGVENCPDCEGGVRKRSIPPVSGVEVLRAGSVQQHFSPHLIEGGQGEGWLSLVENELVVNGVNKRLTYRVLRMPGYYCSHCGERLLDGGRTAAAHVQGKHSGEKSPDASSPGGYEKINFYDCELVAEMDNG